MTEDVFKLFWEKSSKEWYEKAEFRVCDDAEKKHVKDYCEIKTEIGGLLYSRYTAIKELVKDVYFKDPEKKLSRYKRAAVIAQVILLTDPLEYKDHTRSDLDPIFLKQRLAFCVALDSITQAYPSESVDALEKPLYQFDELDIDCHDEDDSFLLSVYKDMFFAELYENYNILTMANVFGLLTERVSKLKTIKPSDDEQ